MHVGRDVGGRTYASNSSIRRNQTRPLHSPPRGCNIAAVGTSTAVQQCVFKSKLLTQQPKEDPAPVSRGSVMVFLEPTFSSQLWKKILGRAPRDRYTLHILPNPDRP